MHQFIVDRARRDETAFRLKLVVAGIEIKKTEDDYCNVDFEILHGERAVGYIELKTRYCDTSRYPDLFIGAVKLHAINADFPNTFLVWDDKFSGTLYWCNVQCIKPTTQTRFRNLENRTTVPTSRTFQQ